MALAKGKKPPTATIPAGAYAPPPPPDAFGKPSSLAEAKKPSGDTLHDLFSQQMRTVLDSSDLDDEEKQSILVAMNCPCCGAGGASFSFRMRRRT
jgi:hypothetical protein